MKEKNEEKDYGRMLFFVKPKTLLIELSKNGFVCYSSKLARKSNITYSHSIKILKIFEEMGLVKSLKDGRTRPITITLKGKQIANHFIEIENILKNKKYVK